MKYNIEDALALEVKQEIANRYFGFRKLIEDDKLSLQEKIHQYAFILEKRISFDLIRIYILLHDEKLIQDFLKLTGLEEELFYDPYLTESKTIRQRVFEGVKLRGLTRKGIFSNAVQDCYERLVSHVADYREKFSELVDAREMISEEIKLFYRKNDLGSILTFLRSLGDSGLSGHMQGGMENNMAEELEKKLQIQPPEPLDHFLPIIPPLVPLQAIQKELRRIISAAYDIQKKNIHYYLGKKSFDLPQSGPA